MSLLLGGLLGLILGAAELELRQRMPVAPDLAAVALGGLLLQAGRRRTVGWVIGLLLGFSTWSADRVGALWLGGGMAALLLVPLREVVFLESAWTQALFALVAAVALRSARELYAWFDLLPRLPFTAASFTAPLLAALLLPILLRVGGEVGRMARRLVGWIGAWRARTGRQAP
ncbi:MAG: hypothetical protein FJ293_05770 [Planctomycetes bacterium]|nr:hypothetical protein [Planctomycetota bacterium]